MPRETAAGASSGLCELTNQGRLDFLGGGLHGGAFQMEGE